MPEERSSQDIGGEPTSNASAQAPIQAGGNQGIPPESADPNPDNNENSTVQLQKDIRGAEKWLIGIGIATVLINTGIALIYLGQLHQMRIATTANTQAVNLAQDSLMTSDSHFDRVMRQTISQTAASIRAANAAKSAADTAKEALHVSERAYVIVEEPRFDFSAKSMMIPLVNTGHLPSGKAVATVHEATFNVANFGDQITFDKAADKSWQHVQYDSVVPGSHQTIAVPLPLLKEGGVSDGLQSVIVAGTIVYNDGFAGTSDKTWRFCFRNVYHTVMKKSFIISCNPDEILPKLEQADGYPNNETPH